MPRAPPFPPYSTLTPEEQAVVDQIASGNPPRNATKILRDIRLAAEARARAASQGAQVPDQQPVTE